MIYKALLDMYTNMKSVVKYKGLTSDWFPVLQGTRQGGISSPKLYLLFINGLIQELENSQLGICIYNKCFCSPTVADDMCLASFSKHGLDQMMSICYNYSCKWRYLYNPSKCAVVVFNNHGTSRIGEWRLGPEVVAEVSSYTHLGIALNKYLDCSNCIEEAKSKLSSMFFSIAGSGLFDNGMNPLTMLSIYRSVVLPKSLYGCELWNDVSESQLRTLEISQHKCLRFMQDIPRVTRSDVALSMIGCKTVTTEVDYKKIMFFGQLCRLDVKFLAKQIFIDRLVRYIDSPYRKKGFIPDIYRILYKYGLLHYLERLMETGCFPPKAQWKNVLKLSISSHETHNRQRKLSDDECFSSYMENVADLFTPAPFWILGKQNPRLLQDCKRAANILGRLYAREFYQVCTYCGNLFLNGAIHAVFDCSSNEKIRQKLWNDLNRLFGHTVYLSLIRMDPKSQLTHLCFGLCKVIDCDILRAQCLKLSVKAFSQMKF